MHKHSLVPAIIGGLIGVALIGCPRQGPDLVAEPRPEGQGADGFCRRDGNNLVVRVRNQANPDVVVQSTTIVTFSPGGPRSAMTAPMPGGSFSDVTVEIPSGCSNPDCDFTINVDANNDVSESREDNNVAAGTCIG